MKPGAGVGRRGEGGAAVGRSAKCVCVFRSVCVFPHNYSFHSLTFHLRTFGHRVCSIDELVGHKDDFMKQTGAIRVCPHLLGGPEAKR